jgi:hypothetical protein
LKVHGKFPLLNMCRLLNTLSRNPCIQCALNIDIEYSIQRAKKHASSPHYWKRIAFHAVLKHSPWTKFVHRRESCLQRFVSSQLGSFETTFTHNGDNNQQCRKGMQKPLCAFMLKHSTTPKLNSTSTCQVGRNCIWKWKVAQTLWRWAAAVEKFVPFHELQTKMHSGW